MKTTLEISDALLAEAKALARTQHTTLRALCEEGLRSVVEQKKQKRPFRLKKASYSGEGLQSEVNLASWESIRQMIYEGRGG